MLEEAARQTAQVNKVLCSDALEVEATSQTASPTSDMTRWLPAAIKVGSQLVTCLARLHCPSQKEAFSARISHTASVEADCGQCHGAESSIIGPGGMAALLGVLADGSSFM
jgi:hypothetical protein